MNQQWGLAPPAKNRPGHPPDALREFQFPQSTDLHGRVKQKLDPATACARADFF
jgi:hypothetical protein